jgi:hypothetical protein
VKPVDFLIFDPEPSWQHHHFADETLKDAIRELFARAIDS